MHTSTKTLTRKEGHSKLDNLRAYYHFYIYEGEVLEEPQ